VDGAAVEAGEVVDEDEVLEERAGTEAADPAA
jgi:hypothetical protein